MAIATTERIKLSPPEIARMWGIDQMKVIRWIRSGELKAVNAATNLRGKKPRYLVDVRDLEEFERSRSTKPDAKPVRKKRSPAGTTNYF